MTNGPPSAPSSIRSGPAGAQPATLDRPAPLAAHDNNFGALRLLLATLVIIGHSPPLALGYRAGDAAVTIVRSIAPHELAVNGFFLLSGYLITISVIRSRDVATYLAKRIGRIYPGFAVAYVVSLLLGLLAGGAFTASAPVELVRHALAILRLAQPHIAGAYPGNPYQVLNGSLWTCSYEFACYLMVLLLHRVGLLERRRLVLGLVVTLVILGTLADVSHIWWLHKLHNPLRLSALFLTGGLFYLWGDHIRYRDRLGMLAAVGLALCLVSGWTRLAGVALFGGYLLFWSGFRPGSPRIRRIGQTTDISFGVYLYAWPIQNLLVWYNPGISPWAVCALAIPASAVAGWLSWTLVEKHFIRSGGPTAGTRGRSLFGRRASRPDDAEAPVPR
jgi:peptidoglycan/LPS O-acetylase OafA/YrhL